jgi:hypothetical protein
LDIKSYFTVLQQPSSDPPTQGRALILDVVEVSRDEAYGLCPLACRWSRSAAGFQN